MPNLWKLQPKILKNSSKNFSNTSFSRPEIEVESQTVVKATIVEHAQHDPNVHSGSVPAYTKSKSSCAVS